VAGFACQGILYNCFAPKSRGWRCGLVRNVDRWPLFWEISSPFGRVTRQEGILGHISDRPLRHAFFQNALWLDVFIPRVVGVSIEVIITIWSQAFSLRVAICVVQEVCFNRMNHTTYWSDATGFEISSLLIYMNTEKDYSKRNNLVWSFFWKQKAVYWEVIAIKKSFFWGSFINIL